MKSFTMYGSYNSWTEKQTINLSIYGIDTIGDELIKIIVNHYKDKLNKAVKDGDYDTARDCMGTIEDLNREYGRAIEQAKEDEERYIAEHNTENEV